MDNVYGNVDDPKLARSMEMDEKSATKDNGIEDDVYVNVEELSKAAQLPKSLGKKEAPTAKKASTSKIPRARLILAALILLIILFFILIGITSNLLKYYFNMNNEMSHLKNQASDFQNDTAEKQDSMKTNMEYLNTMIEKLQNMLMAETKQINKTLDLICPPCPDGWNRIDISCYYVSKEETTWDLARNDCYERSSILVMIKDKMESDTLMKLYSEGKSYWIGMRRDPKDLETFRWLDGTQVTYQSWQKNEPNNPQTEQCGDTKSGLWNDRQCSNKLSYICKRIRM